MQRYFAKCDITSKNLRYLSNNITFIFRRMVLALTKNTQIPENEKKGADSIQLELKAATEVKT